MLTETRWVLLYVGAVRDLLSTGDDDPMSDPAVE